MSALSPSEVLDILDVDATVEKRASWEAFEFTLLEDNKVEVVNDSHDEPKEHTYTVHVESGILSDCTCPAFEYQDGACKHMMAIAIREPLLEATRWLDAPTIVVRGVWGVGYRRRNRRSR